MNYIEESEKLKKEASKSMKILLKDLNLFQNDLNDIVKKIKRSSRYEKNSKKTY